MHSFVFRVLSFIVLTGMETGGIAAFIRNDLPDRRRSDLVYGCITD